MNIKPVFKNIGVKRATRAREQIRLQRKAAEERFSNMVHETARSILGPYRNVTVHNADDIYEFSANEISKKHAGLMAITDSVWAPWSKSFRKK